MQKNRHRGLGKTLSILFTLAGVFLIYGSFTSVKRNLAFKSEAVQVQGTVIDLAPVRSLSDNTTSYAPIIEFKDQSNQTITFTSETSSKPPRYASGEIVPIIYAAANPVDAKINSFSSTWLQPIVLGIMAIMFLIFGRAVLILLKDESSDDEHWPEEYRDA